MTNNRYHSNLKLAIQQNLAPKDLLSNIPSSTVHNIKKQDLSNIVGAEFISFFSEQLDLFKELQKMEKLTKTLGAVIKIKNTLLRIKTQFEDKKELAKEIIVDTIQKAKDKLDLNKLLKAFEISKNQFYSWAKHGAGKCLETVIDKCPRTYPGQLTKQEIEVIKDMCSSEKFVGWSIYSRAMYAIRHSLLFVKPSTWYKYIKALEINIFKPKSRRLKYKVGIRAEKPKEILHCDITRFETVDGTKTHIYLVIDNFSRMILSFRVALEVSGQVWKENIISAYNSFIAPGQSPEEDTLLVCDGGPENKGDPSKDENDKKIYSLRKVIAGTELMPESNSMIEAVNKVLKYQFLYCKTIANFDELKKILATSIYRYNHEKPHGSLKGLTPYEAFTGETLDNIELKRAFTQARQERIEINRQVRCENC